MSQLILDPVLSGYNLAKVNDNFKRIEEAFNTLLLHKDGSKALTSDLDVNSQKLLNVGGIEIGGVDLLESIASLQETYNAYISEMEAYKHAVEGILDEAISYGAVDKKSIGNAQAVFTTNQAYAKNSNLTLPLKYIVGKNTLSLSLGHTYLLYKGVDYEEVGVVGEESQTIKILRASGIGVGVTIEQVVDGDNDLIEIFENAQSLYTLLTTNYSPTKVEEFINSVSDVKELGIEDKISELWNIYNNLSALQVSFANTVSDINTKYSTITDMYEDVSTKYSVLESLYPQLVALITDTNFDLDELNTAVANILSSIQELQALTGTIESNAQTASTAATSASTSASEATQASVDARSYSSAASGSANAAATSATNAANSATASANSASEAANSASEASSSATVAQSYAQGVENNAIAAASSEKNAKVWAEGADSEVEGLGGEHSSKGWANIASGHASSASASLNSVRTEITEISNTVSSNAELAGTSASSASASASTATAKASEAIQASVDASSYSSSASESANSASTSATSAQTYASNAANSASAAQAAQAAAQAIVDTYREASDEAGRLVASADQIIADYQNSAADIATMVEGSDEAIAIRELDIQHSAKTWAQLIEDSAEQFVGFNVNDYYKKTEVDAALNNKADATALSDETAARQSADATNATNITNLSATVSELEGDLSELVVVVSNKIEASDLADAMSTKQDTLTFDTTPTANSSNPVTSDGIADALATKQNTLTFDSTPTANSSNPVTSGGIKTALDAKQDTLTFDSTPTADSNNPVTSQGIKAAIDAKDSLPSQTGHAGEYLKTDGETASWSNVESLPSQTGNAGKVLTTDGTSASWSEPSSGRQILEIFYTFRTDVGPINGAYDANGTVYNRSDFSGGQNPYDLLVAGKAKSCSFAEYETQLSTYGSCGLFGLDTETQRFRVPTLKNILEPTVLSSAIGQIVEAGLPNITGKFIGGNSNGTISGAFKQDSNSVSSQEGSRYHESQMSFDASRSSPIYGKSTTVQPQTIKVRPMVQLATGGQEISIEQYSNQLADYAQTYTLNGRIIGELIWAGLPLTNAGVHLLDGSEISNSGIYTQFVSYISSCFENQNPQAKWLKTKGITLPTFTSNTQDSITISDARGNTTNLQEIFNGSSEAVSIGPWSTYWISIDYAKNTFLSSYTIQADNQGNPEYPSDWKLQGSNDGTAWTDIHSKASIVFTLNQAKTFSVDQTVPYKQYRLLFSNGVVEAKGNGELKKVSFSASEVEFGYENSMFATEEQWQDCVAKYGSCGKFVVSASGVRLPKVSDILQGTTDATAVGDLIEAGLPNITGGFDSLLFSNTHALATGLTSGAFYSEITKDTDDYINKSIISTNNNGHNSGRFDASRSSSIYGKSTTVQPQTIKALLYICVATSVKTQIQVDIDNIATDLNGKADKDLSNVTAPVLSAPYVVETWRDGTSWYRKWSDGWIEQGGRVTGFRDNETYYLPFSDTSYNLFFQSCKNGFPAYVISLTTTGFSADLSHGSNSKDAFWYACGY